MKKLMLTVCLGLALVAQAPDRVDAGSAFGLFTNSSCGCNNCGIVIRPYNAFTPVLCGVTCGVTCAQPGCGNQGCAGGGCAQGGYAPGSYAQMPAYGPAPYQANTGATPPPNRLPIAPTQPQGAEQLPAPLNEQPGASSKNTNVGYGANLNRPYVYPVGYYPTPGYYNNGYYGYGYPTMMPNGQQYPYQGNSNYGR